MQADDQPKSHSDAQQNSSKNHGKLGALAVLAAGMCFGTTGTSQTLIGAHYSPLAIGAARLILGAILLAIISTFFIKAPKVRIPRTDLIISALGVGSYSLTFFTAVKLTGVPIATITALGSQPIFTGVLGWLFVKDKPHKPWFVATGLAAIGIVLLNAGSAGEKVNYFGVLCALLAGLGFGFFNVTSRRAVNSGVDSSRLMTAVFSLAALMVSPFLFVENPQWLLEGKGAGLVLWLGVVTTALAYSLYGYGLKHVHAHTASTLVLSEPATATLLAVTVLSDSLPILGWAGVGLVLCGLIYLSVKG